MSNVGATLVKLTLLAGGALAGALIARWYDEYVSTQAEERSQHDRTRYERGLTPAEERAPRPSGNQPPTQGESFA